jgi:phosphate transport system substrate-binding protein
MKKLSLFILFLAFFLAGCLGGTTNQEGTLSGTVKIAGSSTVYPISVAIAEEFNKKYPEVVIPVQSTGTGGGFKNFFIPGKTDINGASRPIKESEIEAAKKNGIEPIEFQVAIDAITVVVNPAADWVESMSPEELRKIWRPDNPAKKWSDINPEWPDELIELYGPTSASGTFDYFTEVIMGESGVSRSDYQGTEQDNTIVQAVSRSKYALGYFGLAFYLQNKDRLKALKIYNGERYVEPSIETARSGEYRPLSRPLFIYVNKNSLKRPEVREFVRFYLERTSTELITQVGYVPVPEEIREENLAKLERILSELQ